MATLCQGSTILILGFFVQNVVQNVPSQTKFLPFCNSRRPSTDTNPCLSVHKFTHTSPWAFLLMWYFPVCSCQPVLPWDSIGTNSKGIEGSVMCSWVFQRKCTPTKLKFLHPWASAAYLGLSANYVSRNGGFPLNHQNEEYSFVFYQAREEVKKHFFTVSLTIRGEGVTPPQANRKHF